MRSIDRLLGWALRAITVSLLVALTVLVTSNIVARYTGWTAMSWFDEVVSTLFAWFIGRPFRFGYPGC